MHRKFIAFIIATAIAITTLSAAPARAGQSDAAKFFAGLAAIAIIGAAIESSKRNNQATIVSRRAPVHRDHIRPDPVRPFPIHPRPVLSRYDLPGQCLRVFRVNGAAKRLLGAGCLRKNYQFSNALPYACKWRFRSGGKTRSGYGPQCLRERGYRIARS
jgi:hypothetical protein